MKFPFLLAFTSIAWIAATGFTAVHGFGASWTTAGLICGSLAVLFGITFCYLAWEFRRAPELGAKARRTTFRPRRASREDAPVDRGLSTSDRSSLRDLGGSTRRNSGERRQRELTHSG